MSTTTAALNFSPTANPITLVRASIDSVVSPQDWLNIWSELLRIALEAPRFSHKLKAIRLLAEYRFGKPLTTIHVVHDPEPDVPPDPIPTAAGVNTELRSVPKSRFVAQPRSVHPTLTPLRALLTCFQFPTVRLPAIL